jgi:Zn-dependent peptidase ImmA (M78 family)
MNDIKPFPGSNRDIERIANGFRESLAAVRDQYNSTFLRELVRRTGGKITIVDDPGVQEAHGGSLVINGVRDYTIFLSPFTMSLRDNFTIAHEIGHYVLHYFPHKNKLKTPLGFTRYGADPVEWQANRFAAALLMPEEPFKETFNRFDKNISMLSGYFSVSQDAVRVRAKSLGLA